MACDESVMLALVGLGETGQSAELAEGRKQLLPARQCLMDIALVTHIEHQPVRCGIEHPVDGHGQLHHPQIGGQVAAGPGYVIHQKCPQFFAELGQLFFPQCPDIGERMDCFQYHRSLPLLTVEQVEEPAHQINHPFALVHGEGLAHGLAADGHAGNDSGHAYGDQDTLQIQPLL